MINKIRNNVFQLHFTEFGSCVYVVLLKDIKIVIDTGSEENQDELIRDLRELGLGPEEVDVVLLTHRHWDHVGNLELFSKAEVYDYENRMEMHIEGIEIIEVPGHTKDSLAFVYEGVLFSGDTLFHNGIGRTDFPESEPEKMAESLKMLRDLDYEVLCPGHI
jgi:glyoxylase-like metal-dependent hydrolase (beta-lactamase superfamily II)